MAVERGDVWRLNHGDGVHIFVAVLSHGRTVSAGLTSYDAMIIGGDHPSYPKGGYDIAVTNLDIEARGEKVDLWAMRERFQEHQCDLADGLVCSNCDYANRILGL